MAWIFCLFFPTANNSTSQATVTMMLMIINLIRIFTSSDLLEVYVLAALTPNSMASSGQIVNKFEQAMWYGCA